MVNSHLRIALTLYQRLAKAYPHEFRMRFGDDFDRLGEEAIPDIRDRYGWWGVASLLADTAVRLPGMYLSEIRQDVVYGLRMMAKSPGFTAAAVLSLGIGIGLCCTILSVIRSIVGPPAGVRDPAALVTFHWSQASYPYFERYRDQQRTVASAAAFIGPVPLTVAPAAGPREGTERIYGHLVSPEYFATLGVSPSAGRLFSPQTEVLGADAVVVVSHRFWRTHLAADPDAVGHRLRVNGRITTIVGVAPAGFLGIWPGNPADLFVPVTCGAGLAPELAGDPLNDSSREIFRVVLRLAPGVTLAMAEGAMNAQARALDQQRGVHREHERVLRLIPAGTKMYISPEQRAFVDTFNVVLWGLVMALVCANVSGLLMARGRERRKEIAVRLSLGAGRARLVRQFLTESVLLSVAGALGGMALAWGITRVLSSLPMPSPTPMEYAMRPDFHVLGVTLMVALLTGIGLGLAPALSSTRLEISLSLKEGEYAPPRGYHRLGVRNLFMLGQMAASLMLLVVTWYAATDFLRLLRQDPGFATADLHLLALDPVRDGYPAGNMPALLSQLQQELAGLPNVRGVTVTGSMPFGTPVPTVSAVRVSSNEGGALHTAYSGRIGARYFATIGMPLLAGREFDLRDGEREESALPAILNQTAARQLFGDKEPIGRIFREGERTHTVVGVTRDIGSGFLNTKTPATIFLPLTREWFRRNPAESLTILARGTADVRGALASLHPELSVFNERTLREDLGRLNAIFEWFASIFACLGLFALLLACLGLGGVTAYAVVRKRREIGIRMALGARRHQIQALILGEGAALVSVGSLLGLTGALTLARLFTAFSDVLARTFGQRSSSSLLLLCAPLLLSAIALLACYIPARRATSLDPVTALREQ